MIIEHHREIPFDELSGAPPAIGQDPVSDAIHQLKRMHPGASFCFGVAYTHLSPAQDGLMEAVFISPLFPEKDGATSWQSANATLVNSYVKAHTFGGYDTFRGYEQPKTSIEEVKGGDIYTRLKLPDGQKKSLTHGRKWTPSAPSDGMRCVSTGKLQRRHR